MNTSNQPQKDTLELSKIFHEIKNPLTLINSSLQLIETEHPEVKEFRFWSQTMKDLSNLRLLLDELSSFQKSDLLKKRKINLFDFTEDLLEATEGFLLESGTPLTIESKIDDLDFYADGPKLRGAVINLLKNAAESSSAGMPILLKISSLEDLLCFSVIDQGCGISEEDLPHLFEPFHTTKPYGTGLGLPIVKKIVEAHNGTISIDSVPENGTTVTILLPIS